MYNKVLLEHIRTISNYVHSVSEHKKRYIRNYTQILENLRNAIVGFFGLRNEFVNVQGNKKRNTQNIQVKKQKKKYPFEFFRSL